MLASQQDLTEGRKQLGLIIKSADGLAPRLVDDLLDYLEMRYGQLEIHPAGLFKGGDPAGTGSLPAPGYGGQALTWWTSSPLGAATGAGRTSSTLRNRCSTTWWATPNYTPSGKGGAERPGGGQLPRIRGD